MTSKKQSTEKPASEKSGVAPATPRRLETENERLARALVNPACQAAITIHQSANAKLAGVDKILVELLAQIQATNDGDLRRAEAILISQAHTLNELFNSLARRAGNQDEVKPLEIYMRLAFKAQAQCRATLETLAAIKNPPVVFAKQANINQGGQQQVNNGIPTPTARAEEVNETSRNELFVEAQHGGTEMDIGTAGKTVDPDQAMATMDEIHRGSNARRKGKIVKERLQRQFPPATA